MKSNNTNIFVTKELSTKEERARCMFCGQKPRASRVCLNAPNGDWNRIDKMVFCSHKHMSAYLRRIVIDQRNNQRHIKAYQKVQAAKIRELKKLHPDARKFSYKEWEYVQNLSYEYYEDENGRTRMRKKEEFNGFERYRYRKVKTGELFDVSEQLDYIYDVVKVQDPIVTIGEPPKDSNTEKEIPKADFQEVFIYP